MTCNAVSKGQSTVQTPAQRQQKRRVMLAKEGIYDVTVKWPCAHRPELQALSEYLLKHPDVTFVPAYRDKRGRFHTMKENRG